MLDLLLISLALAGQPGRPWLEVEAPHVRVVSDADEATGRQVAWQFEQFHALLESLCPWLPGLDRPFTVIAPADAEGMRELLLPPRKRPRLLQRLRSPSAAPPPPGALFRTGQDRHLAAVQADLSRPDAGREGPYRAAFLGLADVAVGSAVPRLPGWLAVGLREVAAGALFLDAGATLGPPPRAHLAALRDRLPLPLAELLAQDRSSPYLQRGERRQLFDAEAWAFVHLLLTSERPRLQALFDALGRGDEPTAATRQALGDLQPLERTLLARVRAGAFAAVALPVAAPGTAGFTVRPLAEPEAGVAQASLLIALRRPQPARERIDRALLAEPQMALAHEVQGLLLEASGQAAAAQQAYARAADLGVVSYLSHLKVAAARSASPVHEIQASAEAALARAVALAPRHAPALSFQGELLVRRGKPEAGLESARRAVALAPHSAAAHLSLARVLGDLRKLAEARAEAQAAADLARTEGQRSAAAQVLEALRRLGADR